MSSRTPPTGEEGECPEASDDSSRDSMAPPRVPCECSCLHCGRVFMSDLMWFQRVIGDPSGFDGYWMCPTPNCGGAGFAFDIFPIDPDHPANEGWHSFDDDEEFDDEGHDRPWDPTESKYQDMDDDDEDDDLEGEEWKLGLDPGGRPEPEWLAEARRQEEERQKQFDEPDLRPRQVNWTPREDPGTEFNVDDIPF